MNNDLGLLKDYGHIIISIALILYASLYTYLCHVYEYTPIDEEIEN